MGRAARVPKLGLEPAERLGVVVIAFYIQQARPRPRERLSVEGAVFGDSRFGACDQLVGVRSGPCDAHDGEVQVVASGHGQQGGENFPVGEIAGDAEQHQRIGGREWLAHLFSTCPPNPKRRADSTRF